MSTHLNLESLEVRVSLNQTLAMGMNRRIIVNSCGWLL